MFAVVQQCFALKAGVAEVAREAIEAGAAAGIAMAGDVLEGRALVAAIMAQVCIRSERLAAIAPLLAAAVLLLLPHCRRCADCLLLRIARHIHQWRGPSRARWIAWRH